MKYENGKDIFPERLLKQIQKYVSGKLVYISSRSEKKKDWGRSFRIYAAIIYKSFIYFLALIEISEVYYDMYV